MLAVEAIELSHAYKSVLAVDRVSLAVPTGMTFGLLGPNGAGKSTIIKMLTTLLPPTRGKARIMGRDVRTEPSKVRRSIGYVPQFRSADPDLSGYENLLLIAKLYGIKSPEREKRILEILDFMGLKEVDHELVGHYSGGMMRCVEIAQALVHDPEVLFLDEPTLGLDPAARKTLWKNIAHWRKKFHTTIFLTTHDMEEADRLCDMVAFMYRGKIVAMDSPLKLKAALGERATLDDVFIHHTGASIKGDLEDEL